MYLFHYTVVFAELILSLGQWVSCSLLSENKPSHIESYMLNVIKINIIKLERKILRHHNLNHILIIIIGTLPMLKITANQRRYWKKTKKILNNSEIKFFFLYLLPLFAVHILTMLYRIFAAEGAVDMQGASLFWSTGRTTSGAMVLLKMPWFDHPVVHYYYYW